MRMKDFTYHVPTEVVFGKDAENEVATLLKKYGANKVLIHYGSQSVQKSGLLDKVCNILKAENIDYVLLGGVVPNPRLSKVHEGIELCRKEQVDFILAIGGGSVIDSSKAISSGFYYSGDVWDFFLRKAEGSRFLPLGCILTIPAAGSEMSDSLVITNENGLLKKDYGHPLLRCKFSIMNPERTYTLPDFQTVCGATDMMMHTMERYFSHENDMSVTDGISESILRSIKESIFEVLKNPTGYIHRAQIMWAGSLAHNDLTGCGTIGDWSTHMLEHELSGLFDVAHGAGLAAIWGSWARYVYMENPSRFARFAVQVMGVNHDFLSTEATAIKGIEAMERFYKAIGMPTSIKELIGKDITEAEIQEMAAKCSNNGLKRIGNFKKLQMEDMVQIYQMAK